MQKSCSSCKIAENSKVAEAAKINRIFLAAVRLEQLAHATFTLIPVRDELSCIGPRLSEALLSGSIPIIVSYSGSLVLDYLAGGSINWKKATIQISYARLPELPFMISSLTPDHVFHLRRQGIFFLDF